MTEEDEDTLSDDTEAHREDVEDELRALFGTLDENPSPTEDSETAASKQERAVRSDAFRVGVRKLYGYQCCVCGADARGAGDGGSIVEAAHIVPKSEGGPDDPRNGIALCRNHHWAFDNGFFDITEDRTVQVYDDRLQGNTSDFLTPYDGEPIAEPKAAPERYRPHPVFLKERMEIGRSRSASD